MRRRPSVVVLSVLAATLAALACNLGPSTATPSVPQVLTIEASNSDPGPPSGPPASGDCHNDYFPSEEDTTWESVGTNNVTGDYQSTATIVEAHDDGFTVRFVTSISEVDFVLEYGCTDAGLVMLNPMGQFGTASASGPSGSATVNTTAASGITLPSDLHAGQTWQQYLGYVVLSQEGSMRGEYTADNIARGLEVVTVPFGTFNALRVDTEIQTTIDGQPWGPCQQTAWVVKDIGNVKGESSCGGIDDSNELVSFDSP